MGSITAMLASVSRALVGSGIWPQTSQLRSAGSGTFTFGFISPYCRPAVSAVLPLGKDQWKLPQPLLPPQAPMDAGYREFSLLRSASAIFVSRSRISARRAVSAGIGSSSGSSVARRCLTKALILFMGATKMK